MSNEHPLKKWARLIAQTLSNDELSSLVFLLDGDLHHNFVEFMKEIDSKRNPHNYRPKHF